METGDQARHMAANFAITVVDVWNAAEDVTSEDVKTAQVAADTRSGRSLFIVMVKLLQSPR